MDQAEILRRWVKRKEQGFDIDVATALEEKAIGKTTTIGFLGWENELLQNSNLLANIAVSLSKRRKRVLVVDAHKGKIDPSIPLGVFPKIFLEDLLYKRHGAKETVYMGVEGVRFVKASDTLSCLDRLEMNAKNNFFREWASFEEGSDMVFVHDAAPSPVLNFNQLIVVTSTHGDAITAVYEKVRKFIRNDFQDTRISLIVNMCTTEAKGALVAQKFIATAKKFLDLDIEMLGAVSLESEVIRALKARTAFVTRYPYLSSTNQVHAIADKIIACKSVKEAQPEPEVLA